MCLTKTTFAALAALLVVGCTPRSPACKNDSHCGAGEQCRQQRCQPAPLTPAPAARSGPSVRQVMEDACKKGNTRSCFLLGRQHHQAGDRDRARPLLEKACNGGHTEACALAGRAVPYTAFVRHGVAGGLRLASFMEVTLVKLAGPGGDRLAVALRKPLQDACGCMVGYSEDLDFLGKGDLMVAGVVLTHSATPAGGATPAKKSPPAATPSPGSPVPGLKATPEVKTTLPAGRCKRTEVAAKFWLIHKDNHKKPATVLVRGQSGAGACAHSMERAMAALASDLVALLKGTRSWKVQLFRDPALPALGAGNAHLEAGRFQQALTAYDEAVAAARDQKLPAASLGHALYSRGVALAGLGRYSEAMKAMGQAREANADVLYMAELRRLQAVQLAAWQTAPPRYRKLKKKKKRRAPPWGPRLKRRVVWE